MAKQSFTVGQVLTAAQLTSLQQTAMLGGAASAKTASYTLVAADAGTTISMTSTSATTVTVNTGLFAAGDTVFIQNLGTGNLTITAGSATVATAGSLILPQNDAGILYFVSTSSSVFYDFIQVGAASPLTTKGDLYTFSTSDARLGVGANNTVLTADSAEATGLKWATPAAGGGMTLLDTMSLSGSSVTSATFSSAYKQLVIYVSETYGSSAGNTFFARFNGDTGTNYAYHEAKIGSGTSVDQQGATDKIHIGEITDQSTTLRRFNSIITLMRPSDTGQVYIESRTYCFHSFAKQSYTTAIYDNSAAITSFTFFPDTGTMTAGTIYIYGVN